MKLNILWLKALSCNGNAHSLLNYPNFKELNSHINWLYHTLLPSQFSLTQITQKLDISVDILILEGTIDYNLEINGVSILELIDFYGTKAKYILSVGSCASFGGIFMGDFSDRAGFHFKGEKKLDRFAKFWQKSITLSGCPIHPEILATTILSIKEQMELKLDSLNRPLCFYAYTIHNGCLRNEYFEYKIDEFNFGELEGCMFYDYGCQGTYTHGSCNKILWNETSSKTRVGQPCFGCTEPTFPTRELWQTKKYMGIPAKLPLGVPKRAYLSLTGVAKAFKIERFQKRLLSPEKEPPEEES